MGFNIHEIKTHLTPDAESEIQSF